MGNDTKADGHLESAATLERRYIQLLEKRVAQLEARLEEPIADSIPLNDTEQPSTEKELDVDRITSDVETSGTSSASLVHVVVSKFDHVTSQRRDFDTGRVFEGSGKSQVRHPVIFRRYMESEIDRKLQFEELDVSHDGLKELLRENLRHYANSQFNVESVNFRSPFRNFVWQWDELKLACEIKDTDKDQLVLARRYLTEIMGLIERSEALDSYFKSYASNQAGGTISFEYLWTIFPPGAQVLAKPVFDEFQAFEVQYVLNMIQRPGQESFVLVVTGFDWDGVDFVRASYRLMIPRFEGRMSITNLACFPISGYRHQGNAESTNIYAELLARGQRFADLCASKTLHHRYEGSVLFHYSRDDMDYDSDDSERSSKRSFTKSGQLRSSEIIVDNSAFLRSHRCPDSGSLPLGLYQIVDPSIGECPCSSCAKSPTQKWSLGLNMFNSKDEQYDRFKQSDEVLVLCPPRVLGYSLKLGRWGQFNVNNVQPFAALKAEELEDSFISKLRINPDHKKLIRALVEAHQNNSDNPQKGDIVEGKGKGLVILLHGPPGVGKTLTAETVALATHKPLMLISTAEIGLEPDDAERNLTNIFEDASRWQAILLMQVNVFPPKYKHQAHDVDRDEADIFLEERRGTRDLQRNALVAVLLRVLEYYEGIIIMTTNRITSLDVAVESRIHLAIRFRDLGPKDKLHIFQNILDEVVGEDNVERREEMDAKIEKILKRSRINGRQIRNIVTSANLLAKWKKKKLNFSHIDEVYDITEEFLNGLKDLTQKKRILNEGLHDDSD